MYFNLVVDRFPYIPPVCAYLIESAVFAWKGTQSTIVGAVKLLQQMNEDNKRKLPDDAPLGFIPKKLRGLWWRKR